MTTEAQIREQAIERIAKAIAENGVGRPWPDDFHEVAIDDLDQGDIRAYAEAALDAATEQMKPLVEALAVLLQKWEEEIRDEYEGTSMLAGRLAEADFARQALATIEQQEKK